MGATVHGGQPAVPAQPAAAGGGAPIVTGTPPTPAPSAWSVWLKKLLSSGDVPAGAEPGEVFKWTTEEVGLLGDAPFDTGYILTAKSYWLDMQKAARKSYEKFAYVFNRLGFKNPLYVVLLMACIQYFTALGRAFWRWKKEDAGAGDSK